MEAWEAAAQATKSFILKPHGSDDLSRFVQQLPLLMVPSDTSPLSEGPGRGPAPTPEGVGAAHVLPLSQLPSAFSGLSTPGAGPGPGPGPGQELGTDGGALSTPGAGGLAYGGRGLWSDSPRLQSPFSQGLPVALELDAGQEAAAGGPGGKEVLDSARQPFSLPRPAAGAAHKGATHQGAGPAQSASAEVEASLGAELTVGMACIGPPSLSTSFCSSRGAGPSTPPPEPGEAGGASTPCSLFGSATGQAVAVEEGQGQAGQGPQAGGPEG